MYKRPIEPLDISSSNIAKCYGDQYGTPLRIECQQEMCKCWKELFRLVQESPAEALISPNRMVRAAACRVLVQPEKKCST